MKDPNNIRGHWKTTIGFLLAAAGSAIGLGNIWRFPYVVGTNGGAAFVLLYLFAVVLIGYPLMVTELTLGRESQRNPVGTFKKLAPNTPWWLVGALGVLAGFVILSFYSVVSGWALSYFFKALVGHITEEKCFVDMFIYHVSHPVTPIIWHGVFMGLTVAVIALGVVKGIERFVKILMPLLLGLLFILVIRSVTLPGAGAGLIFYLKPDFSAITAQTILSALGQSFFSLSLGMGAILTYGSYLSPKHKVNDNAVWIMGLDTFIALIAGFAILPAVFALGFDPAAGGGLAFITLPGVFATMPGGTFFGALFFLLLSIAALTSAFSLLEVVVSWLVDEHKWKRPKAAIVLGVLIFVLGVPASLSFGVLEHIKIGDMIFFDFLDFLQESFILPLGALLTAIFAAYIWKAKRTREAANSSVGLIKLGKMFDILIKFIVPLAIIIVMVFGLIDKFSKEPAVETYMEEDCIEETADYGEMEVIIDER